MFVTNIFRSIPTLLARYQHLRESFEFQDLRCTHPRLRFHEDTYTWHKSADTAPQFASRVVLSSMSRNVRMMFVVYPRTLPVVCSVSCFTMPLLCTHQFAPSFVPSFLPSSFFVLLRPSSSSFLVLRSPLRRTSLRSFVVHSFLPSFLRRWFVRSFVRSFVGFGRGASERLTH